MSAAEQDSTKQLLLPRHEAVARSRLRRFLLAFFLLLTLPFAALLQRVYEQLQSNTFLEYRSQAEEVATRIDRRLSELLQPEELRPFAEYQFFKLEDSPLFNERELSFSPLSKLPPASGLPGLVGYFQVGPDQRLLTPLLPDVHVSEIYRLAGRYGISQDDLAKRLEVKEQLASVLSARLLPKGVAEEQRRRYQDAIGSVFKQEQKKKKDSRRELEEERSLAGSAPRDLEMNQRLSDLNLDTKMWERQSALEDRVLSRESAKPQKSAAASSYRQSRKELIVLPSTPKVVGKKAEQYAERNQAADLFSSLQGFGRRQSAPAEKAPEAAAGAAGPERDGAAQEVTPPSLAARQSRSSDEIVAQTFEGAIDPFQTEVLDQTLVFFRRAWQSNQRYTQGFVVRKDPFLEELIAKQFYTGGLSDEAALVVAHRSQVYAVFPAAGDSAGEASLPDNQVLLYRSSLSAPLQELELLVTLRRTPKSPGETVVNMLALAFGMILLAGIYAIYALGVRQIALAQQRSDFVSAVSHELKTPLTSIRMYAEMLREGWVQDAAKQRSYYDFIFFEAERLSRLIANVLQLSRLQKSSQLPEARLLPVSQLLDLIRSKVTSQAEAASFTVEFVVEADGAQKIKVDEDSFVQIITNLVDNAIKFSAKAEQRRIVVGVRDRAQHGRARTGFYVRDFGPGVERGQIKRIFELFYRGESELTRTTPGTGIGLALVHALARAMDAEVEVQNMDPGARFEVLFPVVA